MSRKPNDLNHSIELQKAYNAISEMGFYFSRIQSIGSVNKVLKLAEKQLSTFNMFAENENQNSKNNTI